MHKKSQGLSINVIIIVAIALIVLVVLIAVFTGRMGSFVGGVDQTATCEASCNSFGMDKADPNNLASRDDCNLLDRSRVVAGVYNDLTEGQVCCCKRGTATPAECIGGDSVCSSTETCCGELTCRDHDNDVDTPNTCG